MEFRTILHGIIHGKTVELAHDPGIKEGQQVEVTLRVPADNGRGEGLRRAAGALSESWCAEDEVILDRIHHDRKWSTDRELPS